MTSMKQQPQHSRWAMKLCGFLVLVGVCGYVFQSMELIDQGYRMQEYEDKIQELRSQSHDLMLTITVASSVERLSTVKQSLQLQDVTNIRYIKAGGSQVTLAPFFE